MKINSLHETMVKIGAYVISEFGSSIADQEGKSYEEQFHVLERHFYQSSNMGKGIMLTSFMKMVKNSPELRHIVIPLLTKYADHWDEDLQQRACEYLKMLERASEDQKASLLVMCALEKMPNFSEDLQTNNVLTRRILALKVKKGFAINQEEAEKTMKQNMEQYKTTVSTALSKPVGESLAGGAAGPNFKTDVKAGGGQQVADLIDFGEEPPKASGIDDLLAGPVPP